MYVQIVFAVSGRNNVISEKNREELEKYICGIILNKKSNSSNFINDKKWLPGKFKWQDGFGAYTYSRSQIDTVVKYIINQPKHHKKQSFREEYLGILKKLNIEYDVKYLFEWYND